MNGQDPQKQRGQSIVLVAVVLVALVIFAAMTVDMSSAYYNRRTAQNAADASALAGAQELGIQLNGGSGGGTAIDIAMKDFAERNGIEDTNGLPGDHVNHNVVGYYLDSREVRLGEVSAYSGVPQRAVGIEAVTFITAPTYFGGIVGFDGYPLQAEAAVLFDLACTGESCMLPIAIRDTGFLNGQFSTRTCFNMWDGEGSGNFGWLNWSLQSPPQGDYTYSCQDEYLFSLGYEGNLPDDCSAQCLDINMDPQWCNRVDAMDIEVGDYVGGEPGVMDARYIRDWLEHYILEEIRAKIVVYDDIKGQGGCGKLENRNGIRYRVAGFACFYITGFRLSRGTGQEVRCDLLQDGTTLECGEITGGPYYADPSTCTNYPGDCVRANGDPCDWEPSEYNRITGYIIPCAGGDVGKCHAVGNLLAPMLSK